MVIFPEDEEDIHFKRKVHMLEKAGHRAGMSLLDNFLHSEGNKSSKESVSQLEYGLGRWLNRVHPSTNTNKNSLGSTFLLSQRSALRALLKTDFPCDICGLLESPGTQRSSHDPAYGK